MKPNRIDYFMNCGAYFIRCFKFHVVPAAYDDLLAVCRKTGEIRLSLLSFGLHLCCWNIQVIAVAAFGASEDNQRKRAQASRLRFRQLPGKIFRRPHPLAFFGVVDVQERLRPEL